MSVRKLAEGRWQVDTHGIDGRRVRRNRRTQAAAQKLEREIIDAREKGESWDDRQTLAELWNDFEAVKRPAIRAQTWKSYETHWRLYIQPRVGGQKVRSFNQPAAQRFVTELHRDGVSPANIRSIFSTLSTLLGHAAKQGDARQITARLVEFPRAGTYRPLVPTLEEIEAVAQAIDPRVSVAVYLGSYCTMRWGEVFGLHPLSIMWERNQIHVRHSLEQSTGNIVDETKSSRNGKPRDRRVLMPAKVKEALIDHTQAFPHDSLVFPIDGEAIKPRFFYRCWDAAIKQAGTRPFTFHGLRHASVAIFAASGWSIKETQLAMGHASSAFTLNRYGEMWEEDGSERLNSLNTLLGMTVPRAGVEPASPEATGFKPVASTSSATGASEEPT